MPRYTIWIRKEDEKKWLDLGDDRAEWLHDMLNRDDDVDTIIVSPDAISPEYMDAIRDVLADAKAAMDA